MAFWAAAAPIIASGISAGGSLLGGMMGASGQGATNAMQMAMFQQQMDFNRQEAQTNRDWQAEMSNTAYQRSMADMRAAGLNPILAAGLGGASSPGGAQGNIGAGPTLGNPGSAMGAGVSSAAAAGARAIELKAVVEQANQAKTQASLNTEQEKLKKAEEALTQELNTKAKQDTATSAAQQHGINTTAANTAADTVNKGIQSMILSHDATTAFHKSRLAQAEADQAIKHGPGPGGQIGGTAEKWIGRLVDTFRNPGGENANAITSPTDPRWWGLKGRDSIGKPGEGLVIDMKRK